MPDRRVVTVDASMYGKVTSLLETLEHAASSHADVIAWGCPIPAFGDLSTARFATLGINPSNREFVDAAGYELTGQIRRFHSLHSLGLETWLDADARHLEEIIRCCAQYFTWNPYDAWFKRLDQVIGGMGATFYGPSANACHLDLIPFATQKKWTELSGVQRSKLLGVAAETLGILLASSPIQVLILNGRSVVDRFQQISGVDLDREPIEAATLARTGGTDVQGFGYRGTINRLGKTDLGSPLLVLGYNHNLQSSFGVTRCALKAVKEWLQRHARELR